jgi:hypothetical protein
MRTFLVISWEDGKRTLKTINIKICTTYHCHGIVHGDLLQIMCEGQIVHTPQQTSLQKV